MEQSQSSPWWRTILPAAPQPPQPQPPPPPPPAPAAPAPWALARALTTFDPPSGWRTASPVLGALVVLFGLLLVQPPFVTTEPAAPYEARRLCTTRVLLWSAGSAALMYALPLWRMARPDRRAPG